LTGAMRALEAMRSIHQCPRSVCPKSRERAEAGSDILCRSG
jgi:hypothetical protein